MKSNVDAVIRGLYLFLASSSISLIITLVFVLILVNMEQGSIVIIDLFHSPIQFAIFLVLINLIAILVSLYPVYISQWLAPKTERKRFHWKMHYEFLRCIAIRTGLGLIEYEREIDESHALDEYQIQQLSAKEIKEVIITNNVYSKLRKFLGVVFHLGTLYIFFIIFKLYFQNVSTVVYWVFCFVIVWLFFYIHSLNKEKHIRLASLWLMVLFIAGGLLFIATVSLSAVYGWFDATYYCALVFMIISLLWFILFRRFRTHLLHSDAVWLPFQQLANNKHYLIAVSAGGWLSLLLFVYAQFAANRLNAAIIILSLFYVFYGIIIIPVKHFLMYEQETQFGLKRRFTRFVFLTVFPLLPPALLIISILMARVGNDLHTLPDMPQNHAVTEAEFLKGIEQRFEKGDTLFFISSYGGGLRANVWTQKVLSTLQQYPYHNDTINILDNTVAMSGVSGGGLGLSFYQAMNFERELSKSQRDSIINTVANSNFLSLDVAWTTGYDLVRELLPWITAKANDRSKKSMQHYQTLISDTNLMATMPYQEYYATQFEDEFHPALLLNATSYNNKRGVSCSVELNEFQSAFPDAINLSTLKNTTRGISYLYTTSITNRFPVFSPGAKIENKGIFLDGGYFENSGSLSLYDFYQYIKQKTNANGQPILDDYTIVFIQIFNGRRSYAHHQLADLEERPIPQVKETGEINAILSTISSTSSISNYTEKGIRSEDNDSSFQYVPIYLPYRLSEQFTKKVLFTKTLNPTIRKRLARHNESIEELFLPEGYKQWQIVEPALGRLLSKDAIDYMDQMIEDNAIFDELNVVLKSE